MLAKTGLRCLSTMAALVALLTFGCSNPVDAPDNEDALNGAAASVAGNAISDGTNYAGEDNEHFSFLPPLVPKADFEGVFDGSLFPVVKIYALDNTDESGSPTVTGPPIAIFTGDAESGSESVRVNAEDEHYIVNWHTKKYELEPGVTYRIVVIVDETELGFADVTATLAGKNKRGADRSDSAGLQMGRTLPIKWRVEEGALTPVVPVTGVSLNRSEMTISQGGSGQLTAIVEPADATDTAVTWSTSDPDVATVSSTGLVQSVGASGTATITVTTEDGGFTDNCVVTVRLPYNAGDIAEPSQGMLFYKRNNASYGVGIFPNDTFTRDVNESDLNPGGTWSVEIAVTLSNQTTGRIEPIIAYRYGDVQQGEESILFEGLAYHILRQDIDLICDGVARPFVVEVRDDSGNVIETLFTTNLQVTLQYPPTEAPVLSVSPSTVNSTEPYTLSWNLSPEATGAYLERSTDPDFAQGAPGSQGSSMGALTSQTYQIGVAEETTYYYRVKQMNIAGASPFSNTVSVTILPPPDIGIQDYELGDIAEPSQGMLSYTRNNSSSGVGIFPNATFKRDVDQSYLNPGGTWDVRIAATLTNQTAKRIEPVIAWSYGDVQQGEESILFEGLEYHILRQNISLVPDGVARPFVIQVKDNSGNVIETLFTTYLQVTLQYPPTEAPVLNVSSSTVNSTEPFTLSWNLSPEATGAYLERSTDPNFAQGAPGSQGTSMGALTSQTYQIGVSEETTYYYRVKQMNVAGASPFSNTVSVNILP
ncbi:Ig-like domain-containing protein [Candidatus Zixiibacteriota bacterium]